MIEIEGIGQRVIEDKPAKWIIERYDGMILDIYFDSHQEAKNFGVQTVRVWKLPETAEAEERRIVNERNSF